ncbi:50S ribosomal protein L25/general stress protein Ctc [Allobacillus sp. GCM10007491]|uniref:Large ribosomal subunit protein bL25 n=1 Tax=Allobacillus saliphilus TaxID=2912308 RepID=A0A941CV82_9BACI|nr:50S ribosomal protein L25/general stress protein Ctc [Allobacillus saliphilus]MBR7554299.1 50S ribosomal protein L25/general stress protein Ctc [Allobacillus saliphilus]
MGATIEGKARTDLRISNTKSLRSEGQIPGVLYGKGKEPVNISVDGIDLIKKVRDEGRNAVFSVKLDNGNAYDAMLYDYQQDAIKGELTHVDFYMVDMSQEVDVEVYIRLEGEAVGEKDGGVRQQPMHVLNIRSTPGNIPEEILIDISELNIGDVITVGDLKGDKNYEIMDEDETTIITILPPQQEEVETEDSGEEPAEPELVNAKDDEEEEEK